MDNGVSASAMPELSLCFIATNCESNVHVMLSDEVSGTTVYVRQRFDKSESVGKKQTGKTNRAACTCKQFRDMVFSTMEQHQ